ncbi:hypothetical protein ABZP36_023475 [Zizania latifolia]
MARDRDGDGGGVVADGLSSVRVEDEGDVWCRRSREDRRADDRGIELAGRPSASSFDDDDSDVGMGPLSLPLRPWNLLISHVMAADEAGGEAPASCGEVSDRGVRGRGCRRRLRGRRNRNIVFLRC